MILESLDRIKLEETKNLWSYIALKGAYVLSLNLILQLNNKENKKGIEKKYIEKTKMLLESLSMGYDLGVIKTNNVDFTPIKEHLQSIREALLVNGYHIKICRIKAMNKVLIGAGESFGKVLFEIGLFFDPIFNVPYIPGSSLRGAFSHALEELLEKNGKDKDEVEEILNIIFGSEEHAGLLGVTDAYPVEPGVNDYLFEPDVVTPHYPGAETELDVKITPVSFLTIARGVVFEFYIFFNKEIYREEHRRPGSRSRRKRAELGVINEVEKLRNDKSGSNPLDYAVFDGDLAEAVKELKISGMSNIASVIPFIDRAVLYALIRGVGAKTSVGYSRFEVVEYKSI